MSKKIIDPKKTGGELSASAAPDYLQGLDKSELGTEDLSQFIVPPRIKCVQSLSDKEVVDTHGIGSTILMPQSLKISDPGGTIHFTPIYFFAEWCTWNPLAMKGSLPAIRERSLDMNSPIARKARDPNLWTEPCPENQTEEIRHCEHLNFVSVLHGIEGLENLPVVLTYTRGDHKQGTNLNSLIKMRCQNRVPLYGCVFMLTSKEVSNNKGRWWTLIPSNPMSDPWVPKEVFEIYKDLHTSMKEAQEKIQVDYSDTIDAEAVTGSDSGEF